MANSQTEEFVGADLSAEFDVLDEWATAVAEEVSAQLFEPLDRMVVMGVYVVASYRLEPRRGARVTEVVNRTGKGYMDGRRYFFSYLPLRHELYLLLHPYYLLEA